MHERNDTAGLTRDICLFWYYIAEQLRLDIALT